MTIKKRLILSNIGMILIPVAAFFIIEVIIGYIMFVVLDGSPDGNDLNMFVTLRFVGLMIVLIITNGLLTYFVAKSIINPVKELSIAAKEISAGNLDFSIKPTGKDELGQLSETFEMMRQKLKEARDLQMRYDANRNELIASISHDLKTPMTSIKGYVKGVRDGVANTPEKMDRYMETIYTKANDMDHLIDELFMYSKLDLQQVPFHFERLNLKVFMDDFIEELQYELIETSGSVAYAVDSEESYLVKADREQLKRAVMNIIQNSLKYMDKAEKKIGVLLRAESGHVIVRIKDNGIGIPEEATSTIFDRFYRTDTSRNSSTGGSGLGLAIVKSIIEEHGGKVWAKSKLGEGTSVYFSLPKEDV
ncbi:two-component sensor histidine kinase [Virgibacillus indicus]|uniref:histidine kinase n=1 Tax=Virgibacillus indicus TaxID=2024554 RepID=A0A265NC81_9BACI|nr:HAMP domain-containing sensor histidine kinase [Virgibacillus indicus]OZU88876.1 two-component sensor histidine kinase [Virgibacillus indicus]